MSVQKAQSGSSFRVVESVEEGDIQVKEYIDANDFTFAVSWRGPRKPNISALLGKFLVGYTVASAMKPIQRGRRSMSVRTPDIEVLHYGQFADVRGYAFVKNRLPAGVTAGDLQ